MSNVVQVRYTIATHGLCARYNPLLAIVYPIHIYYIPPPLTVHFPMIRSVRYQPIFHTLYYTLHTEHAYCLSYRILNNVVITTVIEMIEMVEILDGRLGQRSVERVKYVTRKMVPIKKRAGVIPYIFHPA